MSVRFLFNHIKNLRQKNNWKQHQVAEALYMSTPAYCKIEIGTTDVNLSRLDQIAKLYDLSLVELLTGEKAAPTGLMLLEDALLKRENQIKELQKLIGELQEKLHS